MNGDILGLAIKTAIFAVADKTDSEAIYKAMANAIVNHIKDNAVIAVESVSGVTTGSGISGSGSGTIS